MVDGEWYSLRISGLTKGHERKGTICGSYK